MPSNLTLKTVQQIQAEVQAVKTKHYWRIALVAVLFLVGAVNMVNAMGMALNEPPPSLTICGLFIAGFIMIVIGTCAMDEGGYHVFEQTRRKLKPATSAECAKLEPYCQKPELKRYIQSVVALNRQLTVEEVEEWLELVVREDERKKCQAVYAVAAEVEQ